ncbi:MULTISPECIES: hypothetical protein [unclassified Cupriavidus]|uniref:hypothetical protein n=1 Tax=unclassified Cupriavidus TaxID=2640874 RepID=UPI00313BB3F6
MRSRVTSISLTRVEGTSASGITERVASWEQADATMQRWSEAVARDSACEKCEFFVEWANGATYRGRYDLVNCRDAMPGLASHVRELAYLYTGRQAPKHMTPAIYAAFLEMHSTQAMASDYRKLLAHNDLGALEHPQVLAMVGEQDAAGEASRMPRFAPPPKTPWANARKGANP